MGVDTTAIFGIGVRAFAPEDWDDDPYEYFEELLANTTQYSYGQIGRESYNGIPNEWYIFIKDPFNEGMLEFMIKVKEFEEFLEKSDIAYDGEIDLHGGIHWW